MPEGPELHLASRFVNMVCRNRIFTGQVKKSEVSTRQMDVEWNEPSYEISATSRGKEVKLTLSVVDDIARDSKKIEISNHNKLEQNKISMDLLFQFGMSGRFDFYEATELKKHAHLNFFTNDDPKMVLSFVDSRRFGKWTVNADWSPERGPCVLFEYQQFRKNVLNNLDNSAFNKPICEALLNQKYFNGIGNYLRAEILYRLKIPPFVSARSVLQPIADAEVKEDDDKSKLKVKKEHGDLLQLCNQLPLEVVNLGCTGYDPEGRDADYSKFTEWLQCYYNPKMKNMADHNKRTIWFDGNPGPMVPKEEKTRRKKSILKNKKKPKEDNVDVMPKKDPGVTKVKVKSRPKSNAKQKSTSLRAQSSFKKVTRSVLKEAEVLGACMEKKTRKRKLKAPDTIDASEKVPVKQSKPISQKGKNTNQKKTAAEVQSNKSGNGVRTRRKAQC